MTSPRTPFLFRCSWRRRVLTFLTISAISGCTWVHPVKEGVFEKGKTSKHFVPDMNLKPGEFFTTQLKASTKAFTGADKVSAESSRLENDYRLGPGDHFSFLVSDRPEISREEIIVAPDGTVALPRVGIITVQGLTQKQVTDRVTQALKVYYERPEVTLLMKVYNNNRVFVLGRVVKPGEVKFEGRGTLLEALALCGGMPDSINKTYLSRCSIVRGKDLIMWIDLRELLERGNLSLNAQLQNGDVIYIPISEDATAYVLGEVKTPGVVPLRTEINIMNALMTVGGPTKEANLRDVFLIRQSEGRGVVERVNLHELVGRGNGSQNYVLRDGDIVYVPETGLGKFNYFCTEVLPFFNIIGITANAITGFGLNNLYYGSSISPAHP